MFELPCSLCIDLEQLHITGAQRAIVLFLAAFAFYGRHTDVLSKYDSPLTEMMADNIPYLTFYMLVYFCLFLGCFLFGLEVL